MTDTTTIEITTEQRERLREVNSGSAKAAVADALDAYEDGSESNGDGLPEKISEQLNRIESAASTAEERTGTLERKVDELGGR